LNDLRQKRVDFAAAYGDLWRPVATCGDLNHCSKTALAKITDYFAKAPLKSSVP
jgi:hypothetical protein